MKKLVLALMLGALASAPHPSFAQQEALTDKAAALYDEGMAAYQGQKWAQARASLLAAWALKNHWQIAGSLASAEMKLGMNRDAAAHLAYFLRHAPAERRTDAAATSLYQKARTLIGTLVVSAPRDAVVSLDGVVLGKAPFDDPFFVEPGKHALEARAGGQSATVEIDVRAGDQRDIALSPDDGSHGGATAGPSWAWVIATGVLGLGGIAAGAGLTIAANGKASDAARLGAGFKPSTCASASTASCQTIQSDVASQGTLARGAVAGYVFGGAFAATAVGLAVWKGRGSSASVQVGWTGTGVTVGGAW